MADRLLLDTDVLIDFLRKRPEELAYLEPRIEQLLISAVTMAELYSGVREGREREELDRLTSVLGIISVDPPIAFRGGLLMNQYRRSHGLEIADALIAATSFVLGVPLATLNRKHYPMLTDLIVPYEKRRRPDRHADPR